MAVAKEPLQVALQAVIDRHVPEMSPVDRDVLVDDVRAAVTESLDQFTKAVTDLCATKKHRGGKAEDAKSYARACPTCQQLLLGVARARGIIAPDRLL